MARMVCAVRAVVAILLLSVLAKAHDVQHVLATLAASAILGLSPQRLDHHSRRLHADAALKFVSLTKTNNTACAYGVQGCDINSWATLTDAAPEPDTDAAKFVAKLAASGYLCAAHPTAAACEADVANSCAVAPVFDPSGDSLLVETCSLSAGIVMDYTLQWSLCPASMAHKFFTCLGVVDLVASTQGGTSSGIIQDCGLTKGVQCKLIDRVCMPADIDTAYDLKSQAGANKLKQDVEDTSREAFWGCCPGKKLFSNAYPCTQKISKQDCTGQCVWTAVDPSDASGVGMCTVSTSAWAEVLEGSSLFSKFFTTAQTTCKASDGQVCNSKQANLTAIRQDKVEKYAAFPIAPGGGGTGSCSNTSAAGAAAPRAGFGAVRIFLWLVAALAILHLFT